MTQGDVLAFFKKHYPIWFNIESLAKGMKRTKSVSKLVSKLYGSGFLNRDYIVEKKNKHASIYQYRMKEAQK